MDAEGRAALRRLLHGRRAAIADQWLRAIARTGFAPADPVAVGAALTGLADEAGEILAAEGFAPERSQDVGAAVVALGYAAPEALRGTLQTLGRELVADLPRRRPSRSSPACWRSCARRRSASAPRCATPSSPPRRPSAGDSWPSATGSRRSCGRSRATSRSRSSRSIAGGRSRWPTARGWRRSG
jgi:hypothetical protein